MIGNPRCAASTVSATSTPQRGAIPMRLTTAAGSARCPERGAETRSPVNRRITAAANPLARPNPPVRSRLGRTAMDMAWRPAMASSSAPARAAESPRSESRNNSVSPVAAATPTRSAWPLPRLRGSAMTWSAPAARAASAVPSREPSSTTMISVTPAMRRAAAAVAATRSAAWYAGMMMETDMGDQRPAA